MNESPQQPGPGPSTGQPEPTGETKRDAEGGRAPTRGGPPRVDELEADQSRRWHRGDRRPVEAYLADHPALAGDAELLLALINGEILRREELGEDPRLEEYLARFPGLAERVRLLFAVIERLRPATLSAADPGTESTRADGGTAVPQPARLVGYEILGELGRGGMGIVYKARHTRLKRLVALKMVLSGEYADPGQLSRFKAEAEAVARLQHPNIVQIYEVGEQGGRHYIALEFVEGATLAQRLAGTPLPPEEAAAVVQALARAMHYAHTCGILHRDLKPANVLMTADGRPKVSDFGLAKLRAEDAGQTQSGAILGTPSYMAPEQAAGRVHDVGPASDVYALGAILYEALTGRPPFKAPSLMETLEQVRFQEPVPPSRLQPKVPRSLETVCLKCLEKEPHKRYPSADALAEDLRRYLNEEPILARPPGPVARFWLWCHRPERIRDAGAFMVFLGVVCVLWCLSGMAFVATGVLRPPNPVTALLSLMTFILVFYLPLVGIGLGTMARRRLFLWVGTAVSALDLLICIGTLIGANPSNDLTRVSGLNDDTQTRVAVFTLLGIFMAAQFFGYCVALVAYHSNRNRLR